MITLFFICTWQELRDVFFLVGVNAIIVSSNFDRDTCRYVFSVVSFRREWSAGVDLTFKLDESGGRDQSLINFLKVLN